MRRVGLRIRPLRTGHLDASHDRRLLTETSALAERSEGAIGGDVIPAEFNHLVGEWPSRQCFWRCAVNTGLLDAQIENRARFWS